MPQKAKEFHSFLRAELGPFLTELGFRRTPKTTVASWLKPIGTRWLVFWFQPSQWNDDSSPGFSFTVEFRLGAPPSLRIWGFHQRLPKLLTDDERADLLQLENNVMRKLPGPDPQFLSMFPDADRERYLARFRPRAVPYASGEDVWLSPDPPMSRR